MWSVFNKTDVFMITTNPIIKQDGSVVMGRGIALQAKERFPKLPYDFGCILKDLGNTCIGQIGIYENTHIWYFMVKNHWASDADLGVITSSLWSLQTKFQGSSKRIDLNFPGIGNGRLPRDSVLYLLEDLSDNIHIWEYK